MVAVVVVVVVDVPVSVVGTAAGVCIAAKTGCSKGTEFMRKKDTRSVREEPVVRLVDVRCVAVGCGVRCLDAVGRGCVFVVSCSGLCVDCGEYENFRKMARWLESWSVKCLCLAQVRKRFMALIKIRCISYTSLVTVECIHTHTDENSYGKPTADMVRDRDRAQSCAEPLGAWLWRLCVCVLGKRTFSEVCILIKLWSDARVCPYVSVLWANVGYMSVVFEELARETI